MTPRPKLDTHGAAIIASIAKGQTIDTACAIAQIDRSTYYDWQEQGRAALSLDPNSDDPHADFIRRCDRARVDLRSRLVDRVSDLVPDMDAADAIRVLERVDRDNWGRHDRLTVDAGTVRLDEVIPAIARYTRCILDDLATAYAITAPQRAEHERRIVTQHLKLLTRPDDD